MAVIHPDDGAGGADGKVGAAAETGSLGRMLNRLGAFASMALAGCLTVWGCQMAVRDATGVPVVRAPIGPMRVAPLDPGGRQAAHQGLSVNAISAGGDVPPAASRLILAPPPQDLVEEDLPQALLEGGGSPFGATSDTVYDEAVAEALAADDEAIVWEGDGRSLAEAEVEGYASLPDMAMPAPVPAPRSRIGSVASGDAALSGKHADVAWLAQFGDFDSPEAARAEWDMLEELHGDALEGRTRVIRRASDDGGIFYRLRAAGFESADDASRFCAAFADAGQSCLPVADGR